MKNIEPNPARLEGLSFFERVEVRKEIISNPSSSQRDRKKKIDEKTQKLLKSIIKNEFQRNFYLRVYKRDMISKLENGPEKHNPRINKIINNKQELIDDENLLFDDKGMIMNIGEGGGKGSLSHFKNIEGWEMRLKAEDGDPETFWEALDVEKKRKSSFPVIFVRWDHKKNSFNGNVIAKTEIL